MAYDEERGEIVMFGGSYSPSLGNSSAYADTWVWNGSTWTRKTPTTSPGPRSGSAMAYDPVRKKIVLHGGYDSNSATGTETWTWDGANWTKLSTTVAPSVSSQGSMAWDSTRQELILRASGVTWAWNGTAWNTRAPLDPQMVPTFLISHGGKVLAMGVNQTDGKTFLWDGTKWRLMATTSTIPARQYSAMGTYDSVRQRTVLASANFEPTDTSTWSLNLGSSCIYTDVSVSNPINVPAAGGSVQLSAPVGAGCNWSASSADSWVSLAPSTGTGPGTITATIAAGYPGPFGRSTTVRLGGGREYAIFQAAPSCLTGVPLPTQPFAFRSDCTATYTYAATAGEQLAIRASAAGTFGNPLINIQITGPAPASTIVASIANNGSSALTYLPSSGFLTFPSAGNYAITITPNPQNPQLNPFAVNIDVLHPASVCSAAVQQVATNGVVSQPPISFAKAGGATSLSVALNGGCQPQSVSAAGAPWLTFSAASVSPGYTTLTATADTNSGAQRSGTIIIGANSYTVNQDGDAPCGSYLNASRASVDAGRTAGLVLLTSYCSSWTASSSAGWLQVYPLTGSTSADIQYKAFPNFGRQARTGTLTIAGQAFTVSQTAGTGTDLERYVKLLYFNYFGRLPSDAEVAFQSTSGLSREQLALNFFTSQEFSLGGRFIAGLYVGILNRDAEYGGWLFQRDALTTGATTQTTVVDNFINSQEFQLRNGSLNDRAFVSLLYRQVLLREPSNAEIDFQAGALSGGLPRSALARNFLSSAEFAIGTGPRLTAFLTYACLLQRDPKIPEFTDAVAKMGTIQSIGDLTTRQNAIRDQLFAPVTGGPELLGILQ